MCQYQGQCSMLEVVMEILSNESSFKGGDPFQTQGEAILSVSL